MRLRLVLAALLLALSGICMAQAATIRLLPGLANTAGANGTRFESTVWLTSLGADSSVDLDFIPYAGQAVPSTVTKPIRAGETLRFDNVLASLFGLSEKAGTLRARSSQPFDIRGVTANVAGGVGTYGLGMPSVPEDVALLPGETGHAIWISNSLDSSAGYRTNVAVVLVSGGSVRLTVVDDGGIVRGETTVTSDVPVSWQRSVAELSADADLPLGRVEMTVLSGAAIGYTAVVDNVTGDGIAVPFERISGSATAWLLDGVARARGRNGTQWSTEIRLFNPGVSSLDVAIEPVGLPAGSRIVRSLGPRSIVALGDVVAALGGGDGAAGALRLTAARPFLVAARTANADPSGRPGTFSASVSPIPGAALLPTGSNGMLAGLTQNSGVSGFRTNLALLGGPSGSSTTLVLRDAVGASIASATAFLAPVQWMQRSLADWFPGVAIPQDSRVDLRVDSGALDAYASVIDNATGDPVVLSPVSLAGAGCAVPSVSVSASTPSVSAGDSVTLTVSASDATSLMLTPGDLPVTAGTPVIVTPATTTAYRVTAGGACGLSATATAVVQVAAPPAAVLTESGALRGTTASGVTSFEGIPYAAPPTSDLRFRPPAPPTPWTGIRDATDFGSVCPQLGDDGQEYTGSEDCLFMNVWTPSAVPASPLPVLFFIHGGGNVQGEGSSFAYDGTPLASGGPAVVVTINYRLGALGSLVQPFLRGENQRGVAGNYGILDQLAALRWVQRNIGAFSGDPSRVMIFGESAGAVDVCTLLASPLARGLFSRALMESGGCGEETMAQFQTFGDTVVKATSCATSATPEPCLRGLSAEALTRAIPGLANVVTTSGQLWGPNVDGLVLPLSPYDALRAGRQNRVPFAIGSNADETGKLAPAIATASDYQAAVTSQFGLFAPAILVRYPSSAFATPRAAFVAATSDARFTCPARRIARAAAGSQNEPVYRYFFTHALDNAPLSRTYGAYHSLELFFVFRSVTNVPSYFPSVAELALSDAMGRYWTRFAASGDPGGGTDAAWPLFDAARDTFLGLDSTIAAGSGVRTTVCDFWDTVTP